MHEISLITRSYTLGMYYRNDSRQEPHPNPLPGCEGENPCPLAVFTELVRDVTAVDWDAECGSTKWSSAGDAAVAGHEIHSLFPPFAGPQRFFFLPRPQL